MSRRADSPWAFPERSHNAHSSTVHYLWLDIRDKAGLEDVRLHELRRTFASRALALCETLLVIGKMLGHSDIQTKRRAVRRRDMQPSTTALTTRRRRSFKRDRVLQAGFLHQPAS